MERFIVKLHEIACHTLFNRDQKRKFIEAEVCRFVSTLEPDVLPGLKAEVRLRRKA